MGKVNFSDSAAAEKRRELAESLCSPWGHASYAEQYEQIVDLLVRHKIPDQYPPAETGEFSGLNELGADSTLYRNHIVCNSGFALLANDWIRPLAQWIGGRRCLEIMAGSGALSYALAQSGVDIIATDDGSWAAEYESWFSAPWTTVERLDCLEAIARYAQDCSFVICSWPYMDEGAYNALQELRAVNPNAAFLYIGEWKCGVTADAQFFNAVVPVADKQFAAAVTSFKSMCGIHDQPYLLK